MIVGCGYAIECVFRSKNWFDIGKLLFFISGGCDDGYELWLKYSRYSVNYDEQVCYELWSDFDELMPEDFVSTEEEEDWGKDWL